MRVATVTAVVTLIFGSGADAWISAEWISLKRNHDSASSLICSLCMALFGLVDGLLEVEGEVGKVCGDSGEVGVGEYAVVVMHH